MARIKVAVSPFYRGKGWVDEFTGIKFMGNTHGLNVYSIPETANLTGIKQEIRLNTLMLVDGSIGDYNNVTEIIVEEPVIEPIEEAKEDVVEQPEAVVETAEVKADEEDAPKAKPASKKKKK